MDYEIFILKREEFERFIFKLEKSSRARLTRDISLLKENGLDLRMPFAKKIDNKLWELRIGGKQKVRVIYSIKGNQIYIIHWFIKKSKKIPKKELETALLRLTQL